VEDFENHPAGAQTIFSFADNSSVGSYDSGLIVEADQFGGAGGTGHYLTENTALGRLQLVGKLAPFPG